MICVDRRNQIFIRVRRTREPRILSVVSSVWQWYTKYTKKSQNYRETTWCLLSVPEDKQRFVTSAASHLSVIHEQQSAQSTHSSRFPKIRYLWLTLFVVPPYTSQLNGTSLPHFPHRYASALHRIRRRKEAPWRALPLASSPLHSLLSFSPSPPFFLSPSPPLPP